MTHSSNQLYVISCIDNNNINFVKVGKTEQNINKRILAIKSDYQLRYKPNIIFLLTINLQNNTLSFYEKQLINYLARYKNNEYYTQKYSRKQIKRTEVFYYKYIRPAQCLA